MLKINQCLIFTRLRDRERNVMISFSDLFLDSKKSKKPVTLKVQSQSLKEKWKNIKLFQETHLKGKF